MLPPNIVILFVYQLYIKESEGVTGKCVHVRIIWVVGEFKTYQLEQKVIIYTELIYANNTSPDATCFIYGGVFPHFIYKMKYIRGDSKLNTPM